MRPKIVREPVLIGDRTDYVRADAVGKVANEINEKARVEIAALWEAMKGVTNNNDLEGFNLSEDDSTEERLKA